MSNFRTEKDSLGELQAKLPDQRLKALSRVHLVDGGDQARGGEGQ